MSVVILAGEAQRQHAMRLISALDLSAKRWQVEVKPFVKKRSNQQLGLYWKWLAIIADETGNDKDDLHDFFKAKFLEPETREVMGTAVMRYSTDGDAARMTRYMDKVMAFVTSQLGIYLPLPEDQHERLP